MKKYKMMFFAGEMGGGGGGGGESTPSGDAGLTHGETAFEPVAKQTTGERPLPGSPGPSRAETQEPASQQPPAQAFDAELLARTLGETLRPALERAQPEPPMTPEEARRILNFWEPDDNWYKSYDNLETRADAIGQMRDALMLQADTLAQFRMREMVDALRQEIMPGLVTVSQAANEQREARFMQAYSQLAEPALQPILHAVASDMVNRGIRFRSEGELFTALAKGVESVMKVHNPEFKLEAASNGQSQQPIGRGGRQLPTTSPGGGGGTGRREGGGQQQQKSRGLTVFDK